MGLRFDKLSILVVEDTAPMRELLISVLKMLGVKNIHHAADGKQAFESFKKENHDIILTDWVMDPVDGLELAREIRTNSISPNRMVPIIMITGYSAWPRVEKARDAGVTEFLVKPFTAGDIAKRISYVISNPRDFIETKDYFGPDRRRRVDRHYKGPWRRETDELKYSAKG